jgi:hypothetical protein
MSTEKKTYKDLEAADMQLMQRYIDMTREEMLPMSPIWNREGRGKGTVIEVNPNMLIQKCYDLGMPSEKPFNNDARDIWFAKNLEKWEKGIAVNPPDVERYGDDQVVITDGKHRAILAYYLGQETMPIEVPTADAEQIREMLA